MNIRWGKGINLLIVFRRFSFSVKAMLYGCSTWLYGQVRNEMLKRERAVEEDWLIYERIAIMMVIK